MEHHYELSIEWIGNLGTGTSGYTEYSRNHLISSKNKPTLECSSDVVFKGDRTKYNPEDLLLASLSTCHMLWYLHLCADHKIIITKYFDKPNGILKIEKNGIGKFSEVNLFPEVWITDINKKELAQSLHNKAHEFCFISNSCNFPIKHFPKIEIN